jgi:spermidine/putrescine-binding protein
MQNISQMQELIQKTVDTLKSRVKRNLKAINKNQKVIKELLNRPNTPERAIEFEKYYSANKTLLQENNDFINIQLTLINFLEKYKGTAVLDESLPVIDIYSITDEVEVFDLTVKGIVAFNDRHPRYNDGAFIDKMIEHYGKIEEYEKCDKLLKLKSKLV